MSSFSKRSTDLDLATRELFGLLCPREYVSREIGASQGWCPLADVKFTPRHVTVFIDLPGVDEDTIGISVERGELIVEGERDFDHDAEDSEEFVQIARIYGPYMFRMELPEDSIGSEVTAKYKRGVLKVRLPRRPSERCTSIGGE